MLKKTITYTDYDGNVRTEDFYFNFSKAELAEMEMVNTGGMIKTIEKIIAEQDSKRLVEIFKDLILKSYGQKSMDGRQFIKSPELSQSFAQTEAYSNFFMELATDANAATIFMNGIIPQTVPVPVPEPSK
jgi:hypothetical protein